MDYRALGASGLNVPVMGLGTANFRGGSSPVQGVDDKTAARLVDARGAAVSLGSAAERGVVQRAVDGRRDGREAVHLKRSRSRHDN